MGIRVEHNVGGIGGVAAYQAGQGRARERQQKYAMDLYRDRQRFQQQQQLQYQGFRYQGLLQGRQQDAMVARQQKEMEFRKEQGELDREQRTASQKSQFDFYSQREQKQWARQDAKERVQSLPPIPEWADSKEQSHLTGIKNDLEDLMRKKDYDLDDPEVQSFIKSKREEYDDALKGIQSRKPSLTEKANSQRVFFDPKTQSYVDQPGEGTVLLDPQTLQPINMTDPAAAEKAEEQKKQSAELQKRRDKLEDDWFSRQEKPDYQEGTKEERAAIDKRWEERIGALDKEAQGPSGRPVVEVGADGVPRIPEGTPEPAAPTAPAEPKKPEETPDTNTRAYGNTKPQAPLPPLFPGHQPPTHTGNWTDPAVPATPTPGPLVPGLNTPWASPDEQTPSDAVLRREAREASEKKRRRKVQDLARQRAAARRGR